MDHYLSMIRDFFSAHGFARDSVLIEVGSRPTRRTPNAPRSRGGTQGLDERYRFENFVLGNSNELAFAAASQVAKNPGTVYNPLLLYRQHRPWQDPFAACRRSSDSPRTTRMPE